MFKKLFKWIKAFKPVKPQTVKELHYTDGNEALCVDEFKIRKQLCDKLWSYVYHKGTLTHEDLQGCARFLFGVHDFPNAHWRLRYCEKSLLYFTLTKLQPVFDKKTPVQLYLIFVDGSLGSQMQLQIEIRELWEMMEPIAPLEVSFAGDSNKSPV